MKTKITGIFFALILGVMSMSCTRNDGDIGDFFGIWRVVTLEADGEAVAGYNGTLYFMFQSSVYGQKMVNEEKHWDDNVFASWRQEGNTLVIDFSNDQYAPFSITGMTDGVNYMEIENMSSRNMELSYVNPDGVKYSYSLEKW